MKDKLQSYIHMHGELKKEEGTENRQPTTSGSILLTL